jgi:hypothetical protein
MDILWLAYSFTHFVGAFRVVYHLGFCFCFAILEIGLRDLSHAFIPFARAGLPVPGITGVRHNAHLYPPPFSHCEQCYYQYW